MSDRCRRRGAVGALAGDGAVGPISLPTPVLLDLVCAALEAGLPTSAALAAAFDVAGTSIDLPTQRRLLSARSGSTPSAPADALPAEVRGLARALDLADRTGASVAVLLRRAAGDERNARRRQCAADVGRLGVRLVLPLGLTILPSFVLLGVAPVVLGLSRQLIGVG